MNLRLRSAYIIGYVKQNRPLGPSFTAFYRLAEPTRLELATSAVTGQRSNQLSYDSNSVVLL